MNNQTKWAEDYLDVYWQIEQKEPFHFELARLAKAILADNEESDD